MYSLLLILSFESLVDAAQHYQRYSSLVMFHETEFSLFWLCSRCHTIWYSQLHYIQLHSDTVIIYFFDWIRNIVWHIIDGKNVCCSPLNEFAPVSFWNWKFICIVRIVPVTTYIGVACLSIRIDSTSIVLTTGYLHCLCHFVAINLCVCVYMCVCARVCVCVICVCVHVVCVYMFVCSYICAYTYVLVCTPWVGGSISLYWLAVVICSIIGTWH